MVLLTTVHSTGHVRMLSFDPSYSTPGCHKESAVWQPLLPTCSKQGEWPVEGMNSTLLWFCSHGYSPLSFPALLPLPTKTPFLLYSLCYTVHPRDYCVAANLSFSIPSPFSPSPPNALPSGSH